MRQKRTDEFCTDAVRIALTGQLTRKRVASDLGWSTDTEHMPAMTPAALLTCVASVCGSKTRRHKKPMHISNLWVLATSGGGQGTAVEPSLSPTERADPKRRLVTI